MELDVPNRQLQAQWTLIARLYEQIRDLKLLVNMLRRAQGEAEIVFHETLTEAFFVELANAESGHGPASGGTVAKEEPELAASTTRVEQESGHDDPSSTVANELERASSRDEPGSNSSGTVAHDDPEPASIATAIVDPEPASTGTAIGEPEPASIGTAIHDPKSASSQAEKKP